MSTFIVPLYFVLIASSSLKTLEHLIGEREVELSELLRLPGYTLERDSGTGSRFGQADDGGSRYSVAQSTSGFATPSSVLSCQSPAHALRQRHRWPSIGSQSQGNGLLSPDFEFSPSAAGSPMKTTPDGRDVPFPLFPTVRTNGSGYVGSKVRLRFGYRPVIIIVCSKYKGSTKAELRLCKTIKPV